MITDPADRRLVAALADGLPVSPRPYAELGRRAGLGESEVLSRLEALIAAGVISRFGLVVRHRELGYRANAMVVWDIPDTRVDEVGRAMAKLPFVTLCYRRPRRLPEWPYNLFCMIHGRERAEVESQVEVLARALGLEDTPRAVLFSRRRFKQCGARYAAGAGSRRPARPGALAAARPLEGPA